jgi:O-antigen/teichoic acid export membrane protein
MKAPAAALGSIGGQAATLRVVARNVTTRYLAILVEAVLGLVVLPFNIAHLGQSTYGLWMLAASVTSYFSVLDLGYAGALTKFVAHYRARREGDAINEILSTLFFLFAVMGIAVVAVAALASTEVGRLFHLSPANAATARTILVIISLQIGCGFAFSVYGGVVNGFQRYDLNNVVGAASSVLVAVVNVGMLWAGFGVVALVSATTAVRLATLLIYRRNAYRVFPGLDISAARVRVSRLKEVTGFSVFMAVLDWTSRVNYSLDAVVVGAFLGPAMVAVWTVSQRLAEGVQRLTSQLTNVLFPTIVDCDAEADVARLRAIFVHGTRLSLATVLPVGVAVAMLAAPLLSAWVGRSSGHVLVTQLLALVVIVRVGSATAMTVLKGAGKHRLLTAASVVTAGANLGASVLLVRTIGLPGVALGTLGPVSLAAVFVLFPAACRRSGIGVAAALREAVWPAAWPAVIMAAWLQAIRAWVPPSLAAVAANSAVAGLLYLALFLAWGLPGAERRLYLGKAAGLFSRHAEATT